MGKDVVNFNRLRSFVPKNLVISLTRECIMKCSYCYAGAKHVHGYSKNNISLEDINSLLKQAVHIGINHVDLTGGDPFVRKDIFDILDLIESYNMTTNLSLKEHIKLRDEGNRAVLFDEQVEYFNKRIVQITKSEYVFLQLLKGEYKEDELVHIISQYNMY